MSFRIIEVETPHYQNFIKYNEYEEEFRKVAEAHQIQFVYKWKAENGNRWLGFLHGGLFHVFEIPCQIPSIEEYLEARSEGFTTCSYEHWQKLKELGYQDLRAVDSERGNYGIGQWIEIKSQGYNSAEEFDSVETTGINARSETQLQIDVNNFKFKIAIVDGNNISYGDYEESPKLRMILCVYEKLEALGVKPYVVVSAALRHHIDDPVGLVEFLKKDDVAEAPADRSDDFFVIQLALQKEAFIVSNDQFKDWKKANPELSEEIEKRRVALTFIEEDPQFDHKLYTLIKRPNKYRG
jgi:hypothetical protein